jgi:polysaccharide deacetylase family protein (PEP-CTERM system associated)
MKNAFTIDLEDWFCVYNLSGVIPFEKWPSCDLRIEATAGRLLDLLEKHSVKATFFVLGWIAEQRPELIKSIASRGHEIACHGYAHRLLFNLTQAEFEKDLSRALNVLRPLSQRPVIGYRAPSFSVKGDNAWFFNTLGKYGIEYDSSIFPISYHPEYANRGEQLAPHRTTGGLIEFPLSCFRFAGITLPCCGGGYFRLFPYGFFRYGIRRCNARGRPVIFYLHPWEIDHAQPRMKLPFFRAFRHYVNLKKTENRLRRLLEDFEWTTVSDVLKL